MRTTMTLDDAMIEQLMQATGEKSHAAAIRRALQGYLQEKEHQLRAACELNDMLQRAQASGTSPLSLQDIRAQVQAQAQTTHQAA